MKQTICDRCKSVIKGKVIQVARIERCRTFNPIKKEFDLCRDCVDAFNEFMKQENEPTPSANEISSKK